MIQNFVFMAIPQKTDIGNAVPGVPAGASPRSYRTAACGGRNAGDGIPYGAVRGGPRIRILFDSIPKNLEISKKKLKFLLDNGCGA
jgi:hypothetical protein